MARSSTAVALGGLVVVLALVGAALVLIDDGGDPAPEHALRGPSARPEAPAMEIGAPGPRAGEARPLRAPDGGVAPSDATRTVFGGRVVRLADGTPLARTRVSAGDARATTDVDGRFELRGAPSDARTLAFELADGEALVALPAGSAGRTDLRLVADTGWTLAGVVRDRSGGAPREAGVRVPGGVAAAADDGGRFVLRDVRPPGTGGGTVTLVAGAPWHASSEQALRLRDERRLVDGLVLELVGAGRLEGRLVLPGARDAWPELEVSVPYRHERGTLALLPFAPRAAFDGERWTIDGLPAGLYVVRARPGLRARPGERTPHDPTELLEPLVRVEEGRTTTLDLRLPVGAALTGRVLDASGAPLAGARVVPRRLVTWIDPDAGGPGAGLLVGLRLEVVQRADGAFETRALVEHLVATSDERGRFACERLSPGAWTLEVSDPQRAGVPAVALDLELGEGEARDVGDVALGLGLRLAGRLVDAWGGPLAGRVVLLPASGTASVGADDGLEAGDDGAFEFLGLAPGPRRLWASAPGHVTRVAVVDPGGPELVLTLERAALLAGRVRDATSGEPVEAFQVTAASDALVTRQGFDAPDGRFAFDTLPDGEYTLTVSAPGYADGVVEGVRPDPGGGVEVVFDLRPAR